MSKEPPEMVLVDLTNTPLTGDTQMIVRLRPESKRLVDIAANLMNMKQAEFIRTALVGTSKKVIAEMEREPKRRG